MKSGPKWNVNLLVLDHVIGPLASVDWSDSRRVCSFWNTWSICQNFVGTWLSKVSADEFYLIALHWHISKIAA